MFEGRKEPGGGRGQTLGGPLGRVMEVDHLEENRLSRRVARGEHPSGDSLRRGAEESVTEGTLGGLWVSLREPWLGPRRGGGRAEAVWEGGHKRTGAEEGAALWSRKEAASLYGAESGCIMWG